MERQVRVSQSETTTYPLIGLVEVGGLSTSQAGGFSPLAAPDRTRVVV